MVCQSGFEGLLIREATELGYGLVESGPGWILAKNEREQDAGDPNQALKGAAFPHVILEATAGISGTSVNELAQRVLG